MKKQTNAIQLIQDPIEFKNSILEGVKEKIEELKSSYQPKSPEELLSRVETAELLKINISTLSYWTKQGTLKSYGIASRVYYKRSEIMKTIVELK
jgi:hypothetical protein